MDSAVILVMLLLALLFCCSVAYLLYYLSINVLNPSGKGAAKKTASILRRYGLIRQFRVLSDVTLEADGQTAHIENMLIGYFGILLVHTCGARGGYYGTLDGESWIISEGDGVEGRKVTKTTIPNPVLEQKRAVTLMRTLFSKSKLYNIPVESIVYMSSKAKSSGVFITHSGELLLPGKLPAYLNRSKFDNDAGLDIARLADVITGNSASGKRKD